MEGTVAYSLTMNQHFPKTTTAAEGLPRRPFTVAELERMVAAGILDEDERIELIGGEVVPMSPKGNHHEVVKTALMIFWSQRLPADVLFTPETTFRFNEDTYVEPDFVFYPRAVGIPGLNPGTAKLVVEIADSSLGQTRIHRDPTPTGYRTIADLPPSERLEPLLVPALAVTLSELELH
jgi:Uma2 family endonuclease